MIFKMFWFLSSISDDRIVIFLFQVVMTLPWNFHSGCV